MEVVVIPEMTIIHIPIIAIGLKIIPSIYLLIIFIVDVHHNKSLLHAIQRILNTMKIIHIPIITIGLKIIPNIYFWSICIHDILHKISLMYANQGPLNIVTTVPDNL